MIKFVYFTDPHITNRSPGSRLDDYFQAIMSKLRWVIKFANNEGAVLLMGGDIIDIYDTSPEVINAIMKELRQAKHGVYGIIGNHDIYGQNWQVLDKVIVGTLYTSGAIQLLGPAPTVLTKGDLSIQLTGVNYMPNLDRDKGIYNITKLPTSDIAIHIVHGFVVDKNWPNVDHSEYTVITEIISGADVICTGHEHHGYGVKEANGVIFTNPGALGRVHASEGELSREIKVTLIKCYKDHIETFLIDVPHKPGTEVLSREHLVLEKARVERLEEFAAKLGESVLTCDVDSIFSLQAAQLKVDPSVLEIAREAISEFDKRNT